MTGMDLVPEVRLAVSMVTVSRVLYRRKGGTAGYWGSHGPSAGHCGYSPGQPVPTAVSTADFSRRVRNLDLRVKSLDF